MAAINLIVLAPPMVQALSLAQAVVREQEALTLRGQKVVPGVVTLKVVAAHEVLAKAHQVVLAHHGDMVVVMVVVVVEGLVVQLQVLVVQEVFQVEVGEEAQAVTSALQE